MKWVQYEPRKDPNLLWTWKGQDNGSFRAGSKRSKCGKKHYDYSVPKGKNARKHRIFEAYGTRNTSVLF